ncbi:hypothetical protein [Ligilactobacillus sp. Marseille-Q7487]|jgi:hypothetical protein|uniref:hypothetical protein n=1 Tax=Ligilactobacillus sp. Marseille-Q7487 TaxID=3022128 RepID=UPI0015B7668A|nr:hypothetical protein [Ligilactobacillus sp. Marseille-Q7487]
MIYKRVNKGFVLADSIIGLIIVSLGIGTFAMLQEQFNFQENKARQEIELNRQALNESYQVLTNAQKTTNYKFEKITVKQGKQKLEIYVLPQ